MPLFDRVTAPRIDIYGGKTNEYYGKATFPVTTNFQDSLLQIVNYGKTPKQIILQDVVFLPASSEYIPPGLFEKVRRNGIIRAAFRDADSHLWTPADIYISFDTQARGNLLNDQYQFDSIVYTDIVVKDVRFLPQGELSAMQE